MVFLAALLHLSKNGVIVMTLHYSITFEQYQKNVASLLDYDYIDATSNTYEVLA